MSCLTSFLLWSDKRHSDLTQKVSAELRLHWVSKLKWKLLFAAEWNWLHLKRNPTCLRASWYWLLKIDKIMHPGLKLSYLNFFGNFYVNIWWPYLTFLIFGGMSLIFLATLSRLHLKGCVSFICMEHTLQTLSVTETRLQSCIMVFH